MRTALQVTKHMTSLCYNAWSAWCKISTGRITFCVAEFFPGSWQTFVEFIPPKQMFLIIHVAWEARRLHGCNIISTSPQGWSWSPSMTPILSPPILSFSDQWIDPHDESLSFKIIFLCRTVGSSISLQIGPSNVIVILYQKAIHAPVHATSLSHTVYTFSITESDVTFKLVNT